MKIRIKFQKYGAMKFIGHLDMMRYFQKCMRLSKTQISFSSGYSPHMIMSFASPLGVGITSDGEYFDIEVHATRSSIEAVEKLNEVMVEGVHVVSYRALPEGTKNAMSSVTNAAYTVYVKDEATMQAKLFQPDQFSTLAAMAQEFYHEQARILITKPTKKGEKTLDLKELVCDFRICDLAADRPLRYQERISHTIQGQAGKPAFSFTASSGSTNNVKPEFVLEAFCNYFKLPFQKHSYQIHRNEIYGQTDTGALLSLEEYGTEIS